MTIKDYADVSCRDFAAALASAAPVPGGGGAAALVGAIGTALGNMVASLTVGKKKYASVEAEISALSEKCTSLQRAFLDAIRADAEVFAPLAAAYAIPKEDPARAEVIGKASLQACSVPMRILELCTEAIDAVAVVAEKGSRIAVSDAGCAAACLRAAAQSAILNVRINAGAVTDSAAAAALNARAEQMLAQVETTADAVYRKVYQELG